MIRGVRGDQREESKTSTTDLSPPSLSSLFSLCQARFLLVVCFPLSFLLSLTCRSGCSGSNLLPLLLLLSVFTNFLAFLKKICHGVEGRNAADISFRRWWKPKTELKWEVIEQKKTSDEILMLPKKLNYCRLKAQKCVSQYKWSIIDQNISQTPPHDTSLSQAQTRPADDYLQGSWRVLDPDYCGYERSQMVVIWTNTLPHLLTLSPYPNPVRWTAITPQSTPFCPSCRRLLHQHPFHPLITLKCQPWPLSLTPKRPPNRGLIWDMCSHMHREVIIKHLSNISTECSFAHGV